MAAELLASLFKILKDSLASFMLSSRFSWKRYFKPEVSLSQSLLMSLFKTGFNFFRFSRYLFLCPTHQGNRISHVTHNFPEVRRSISFCASISSSAVSRTADVAKTNLFLSIWQSLISSFMKWHNFLFLATASFNIGTRTPIQVEGIFEPSKITFTTAGFFSLMWLVIQCHLSQLAWYGWP